MSTVQYKKKSQITLYIKYVKKAHDVTVMNSKLGMYFLHSLHGQFSGFHSLIPFLKATTLVNSFNSNGPNSHILGPKNEMLSLPWKTNLTFDIAKSELILKLKFLSRR